jgi:Putative mono-oxygenase ydhR
MAARIVQINFTLTVPTEQYHEIGASLTDTFASIPGLQWKIWLLNEENRRAGGLYLFESETAAQAYVDGPIVASLGSAPFLTDLSVSQFGVIEDITAATRGPIALAGALGD